MPGFRYAAFAFLLFSARNLAHCNLVAGVRGRLRPVPSDIQDWMLLKMEVAAGLEPAKTGFADQRLDRFGIATKNVYTQTVPILVPKTPLQSLFTPIQVFVNY